MKAVILVFINVILLVSGQVFWKMGLTKHDPNSMNTFITVFKNPYIIFGCVIYAVATLIWFYALSRYPLSRIYPLQSMAYVLGALSGYLFFKEVITLNQGLGLALVLSGVFFLSK
jgi:drug/metabolite transporter (DMT)-like permease